MREQVVTEPRKSPVQARSAASVDAILHATIQVLLRVGKDKLTTTRVAERAGVSVGTLYQYFPNKTALLSGALRRHLDDVTANVQAVCLEQHGKPLQEMTATLIDRFLAVKMKDVKTSVALYAVSSDVDGAKIARERNAKSHHAMTEMLTSAPEELQAEPETMASMLQGILAGVSRRILESPSPQNEFDELRDELKFMACTYVEACTKTRA